MDGGHRIHLGNVIVVPRSDACTDDTEKGKDTGLRGLNNRRSNSGNSFQPVLQHPPWWVMLLRNEKESGWRPSLSRIPSGELHLV
jgi:hypothetical protein